MLELYVLAKILKYFEKSIMNRYDFIIISVNIYIKNIIIQFTILSIVYTVIISTKISVLESSYMN